MHYSKNIKKIRIDNKLTQANLAEGICSQSTISKIEKNQFSPDIDLMIKIAKKLNTSISQLIGESYQHNHTIYVDKLIENRNYKELQDYVNDNILIQSKETLTAYQLWLISIIEIEVKKNYQQAINYLNTALKTVNSNELNTKLNIFLSLAIVFGYKKQFKKSISYLNKILDHKYKITDYRILIKTYFSLSRYYSFTCTTDETIFYINKTINYIINQQSLYLLDDCYLLLADTYHRSKRQQEAINAIQNSLVICNIKKNTALLPYIERTYLQIQNDNLK